MCVNGFIESKPVKMLVDTGSAITLIRQDCLPPKFACSVVASPNPVVVANGEELELLGSINVDLQIGQFSCSHPVLVAKHLTQECLLGADFLT